MCAVGVSADLPHPLVDILIAFGFAILESLMRKENKFCYGRKGKILCSWLELSKKGGYKNDRKSLAGHTLFNIGFWTFSWRAFELAYQYPSDPIWSGTFGFPIPHHFIIDAILAYVGYILTTFTKTVRERIKRKIKPT